MAESAKEGLGDAISKIGGFIGNEIETEPSIRPVLDLSAAESEAARLNTMFSSTQAMSVGARMNLVRGTGEPAAPASQSPNASAGPNPTQQNVFYIQGTNAKEIADEVSRILQQQVERREAVWG